MTTTYRTYHLPSQAAGADRALSANPAPRPAPARFFGSLLAWERAPHANEDRAAAGARVFACWSRDLDQLDLRGIRLRSLPDCLVQLTGLKTLELDKGQLLEMDSLPPLPSECVVQVDGIPFSKYDIERLKRKANAQAQLPPATESADRSQHASQRERLRLSRSAPRVPSGSAGSDSTGGRLRAFGDRFDREVLASLLSAEEGSMRSASFTLTADSAERRKDLNAALHAWCEQATSPKEQQLREDVVMRIRMLPLRGDENLLDLTATVALPLPDCLDMMPQLRRVLLTPAQYAALERLPRLPPGCEIKLVDLDAASGEPGNYDAVDSEGSASESSSVRHPSFNTAGAAGGNASKVAGGAGHASEVHTRPPAVNGQPASPAPAPSAAWEWKANTWMTADQARRLSVEHARATDAATGGTSGIRSLVTRVKALFQPRRPAAAADETRNRAAQTKANPITRLVARLRRQR